MSIWKFSSAAAASLVLLVTAAGSAADRPAKPPAENTTITARTMTVRNQESKAIFEGAVVMTRGTLTVRSDTMVVFFRQAAAADADKQVRANGRTPDKGGESLPTMSNRSVSMIEALGRVTIEKAEGRAECQKAVYYEDEKKIVLTGDPVAYQKGTRVSGEKMTMFLADDRSVVEGQTRVTIDAEGPAR